MASGENESEITEDEIDRLKLPKAMGLCQKHNITLDKDTKLHQMKWLLKRNLLCKENEREETIQSLDWDARVDEKRKSDLLDIYNNTIDNAKYVMGMEDPVVEELRKSFPDICKLLEDQKQNITDAKAPILVLDPDETAPAGAVSSGSSLFTGETGSGKSSFINLLLKNDTLPCSLLSNTHVICEIRSSNDVSSYAVLYSKRDEDDAKAIQGMDDQDFKTELAKDIQAMDEYKRPVYKTARIYIESDILASGLVIVDSPGVGEAKDMEDMVLEYILNACTFIYIIDCTSAGGMQDRMQKLVQKVHKKALEEQRDYRPESAIFILNKWDEVPFNEREDVLNDTVRKIKGCWPQCRESQIYKFSTLEAAYIQREGRMSPKFRPVLQQISQLVPLGREILLLRGYKFLHDFATKCIHCFGTHLAQTTLTVEERKKMRADTTERLTSLKTKMESFFEKQHTSLNDDIKNIAKALGEYIQKPENMDKVCIFSASEIPQQKEWKETAVAVRSHVYDKIMKLIRTWEEDELKFKKIGEKIAKSIEEQFPKFEAEMFKVQQKMSRSVVSTASGVIEEEEEYIVPSFIRNKFKSTKGFGKKVAIGIGLSPVLVVGMAVNLPVFGFKTLKRTVQTLLYESDYRQAKTPEQKMELCSKYARSTVASITDKLGLERVIEEDIQPLYQYLRQQRKRMEGQIVSDLDLLKTLQEEQRGDDDIVRTYEPLQAKFEIICRRLRHFLFVNLPEQFATWAPDISFQKITMSETSVCSGYAAVVFKGTSKQPDLTGSFTDICFRKTRENIQATNVKKFVAVQEAYSNIKQQSIVQCFGVCPYDGILYQILEPLLCSLRKHVEARQEEMKVNKANTVLHIMKDVVNGLNFLHAREKTLVSLDLSMDTVAVDAYGVIKLTNISLERNVVLKPDYESEKITVGKFVHFHPHFFSYTTKTVPKIQTNKKTNDLRHKILDSSVAGAKKKADETEGKANPESDIVEFEVSGNSLMTCSTDTSVTYRTEYKYMAKDDMYSVGVMMWELWKEVPLASDTLEYAIPADACNANKEGDQYVACEHMEKFMRRFQPKIQLPIDCSGYDDLDNKHFVEDWWATLKRCLDHKMSSSEWIALWKERLVFPSLTLVTSELHFSQSP